MTKRRFAKRVEDIKVSAIKQMPMHARAVAGAVSLGQGIPSLATPSYIRRQIIDWLERDANIGKYSLQPGVPELRAAVASIAAEKAGRAVDADREVFISAGAMEALFCALVSVVESGDEVLLFDPSYASHIEQVIFAGGTPVYVPLREEANWAIDVERLASAVTKKTKAIVVCNPGNPTGKLFTRDELAAIAGIAKQHSLFVIADETYDFLVYDDLPHISLLEFPDIRDLTIGCYSFSKRFAMTGWRVGYMYAPADVIEQALKVHDAAVICAPTISQYAALAALRGELSNTDGNITTILAERRELVCERLDRLDGLFSYVKPNGAYYVFPRYLQGKMNSEEMAMRLLHEAKVITIPGRAFGPSGEGHIRLSYGGLPDEINEAFDRIETWQRNA